MRQKKRVLGALLVVRGVLKTSFNALKVEIITHCMPQSIPQTVVPPSAILLNQTAIDFYTKESVNLAIHLLFFYTQPCLLADIPQEWVSNAVIFSPIEERIDL